MAERTLKLRSPPTTNEEPKQPHKPEPTETLPRLQTTLSTFYYTCEYNTNRLHRADLLTREQSCHSMPAYEFMFGSCLTELPAGSLLITGGWGDREPVSAVVKIDTHRELAVSSRPPMHTARYNHAAVYHFQYLYVLAGQDGNSYLSECERYVCAESRWEVLPALPVACDAMSAVELDNSLYALGGHADGSFLDTVQKLSLDSLTWELMQLKLPTASFLFPCFKIDAQVYLLIEKTLFSFTPLQIKPIQTLQNIACSSSYYSKGTLYYEDGGIRSLEIGELG
jgi:hypothetical protein